MKLSEFIHILQETAEARAKDGVKDPRVFVRLRHGMFFVALPFNPRDYDNVYIDLGEYVDPSLAHESRLNK